MTLAVRQSSGTSPVASDLWNIIRRRGAMSSVSSFSSRGQRLSGPGDLFGLRSFRVPTHPKQALSQKMLKLPF